MPEMQIGEAITTVKKINVAMRAVQVNERTRSCEWRNLGQIENDFQIKLTDNDKRELLRRKEELKRDLNNKQLHNLVINVIPTIFKFEKITRDDRKEVYKPTKEAVKTLNDSAELIALLLKAYDISTSQIRKYLDSLRKIKANTPNPEAFNSADILLQQVKVAYAAGKDRNLMFFYHIMKPAITEGCKEYHYFEQLLSFVEAIVAYHKFYKGED